MAMYVIDSIGLNTLLQNLCSYLEERFVSKEILSGAVENVWNTIEADNRIKATLVVDNITTTYTGNRVSDDLINGTATAEIDGQSVSVAGTFQFEESQSLTNVDDSGDKLVIFIPGDSTVYAPSVKSINVTIEKKSLDSNELTFTPKGTTLGEVEVITPEGWPAGRIHWTSGDDTLIENNTSYAFYYAPDDMKNYTRSYGTTIFDI